MENKTKEQISKVQYVGLLSYNNALNLINYVEKIEGKSSAHITPGGVSVEATEKDWTRIIDFLESLNVRYEICSEHPEKVTANIVQHLKNTGVIEDKNCIVVAVGGYTDPQTKEIFKRRHQVLMAYCKQKGWDHHILKIEQVMEIRKTEEWKSVPQKVSQQFKPQ